LSCICDSDTEGRVDLKKLQKTPSKSDPSEVVPPTPTQLPMATPDYAAGLGAEFIPGPPLQAAGYPERSEGLRVVGGVAVPPAQAAQTVEKTFMVSKYSLHEHVLVIICDNEGYV